MNPTGSGDDAHRRCVAVIIPYYQRSAGLLGRALASVFAQGGGLVARVVVVDDASPLPAAAEIAALPPEQAALITVERQANAGPGAARNRGLDLVPGDIPYAAFLDSDDEWLAGHLERAVAALETGRDLYFSNYRDIGQTVGGFETRGHLDPARHDPLPGLPDVHAYRGDLRDAVLESCPIETSTVVFRRSAFADLRFRAEFRHAYEDLMFWFEMAAASTRVAFSTAIGTQYGTGINMYRGVVPGSDTGSDAALRVVLGSTLFGAGVRASYRLTAAQGELVRRRLDRNRRDLVYHLLFRLRRRRPLPRRELAQYLRADPRSWLLVPAEGLRQIAAWVTGRGVQP